MLRIVNCLTSQHDWRLVLLAGAVCFLTSMAAIQLFLRARETTGRTRLLWLITTGAATGYGIWATHFIAMLAFSPRLPTGYDLSLTLLSLFAAALITGGGFVIAIMIRNSWAVPISGTIIGLGIAAMHYTGMAAFQVPGTVNWASDLVVLSIALGTVFSVASTMTLQFESLRMRLLSTLLLAVAILTHHFTAMGAVVIQPDPTVIIEATALSLSPNSLSMTIASAASAVLGMSLLVALEDRSRQLLIKTSDAEISRQAQRLETALANMSQGLCMFDKEQRVIVANRRYAEMYGLDPEQIKPGTTLGAILMARVQRGIYGDVEPHAFIEARTRNLYGETEEIVPLADGRFICVLGQRLSGGGLVITHEDITERHLAAARITHLAHHDSLTNLPNRALLRERLDDALEATQQRGPGCAVLMLDLDRFKEVNDTLGHSIGDALLKAVAERLRGCVKDKDTIARLGGDEFAIVQRGPDLATNSAGLANRILDAINTPFELNGHQVSVGISIGIAIAPDDGADAEQLLKNVDLALCQAKSDGRGAYRRFEQEMDRRMQERRDLERDMRIAFHNREFVLYYQPLVDLESDEICGFEALLRWHHPEQGNISPERFIPVAEETGLIVALGEWVLKQACTDASTWPPHLKIAVNVSPAQFQARNFADTVSNILHATGMVPQRLELEITETVMMKDEEAAFSILTQLHELGVRIALDDFGTGYSSLSNLRRFPFDKIKIDRSFVGDLSVANVNALALVRSVAQLGVSLGMATTAEGVETREQLETVRAEGCAEIQGYYVSPPAPAKDIERLIVAKCNRSASAA